MSYGVPVDDLIVPTTYVATFEHVNGTQVRVTFYDPNVMGPTVTTDDDFQSAVDALSNSIGWTFVDGRKSSGIKQEVTPT
jgi:hypothetical protein